MSVLLFHLLRALILSLHPSGYKRLIAENLMLRQQLMIMQRNRKRSPNLTLSDRLTMAGLVHVIKKSRISHVALMLRPETLLKFHQALVNKKYQKLFCPKDGGKPGPKGPTKELVNLILEMKKRNPCYGYHRIAMQMYQTFGIEIDKHLVRRVLQQYYKPQPPERGQSWLAFMGHAKDSLWSVDFFRCESVRLQSFYVMVVIDQLTREVVGFSTNKGSVDGNRACAMFNKIISGKGLPIYLSSDNDPLFKYHRWKSNCRILGVQEIKTLPGVPRSHPFIERTIGSIRREFLDKTLFWNEMDLQRKLNQYQSYFNKTRGHSALVGKTPKNYNIEPAKRSFTDPVIWKSHCRGLYVTPIAA